MSWVANAISTGFGVLVIGFLALCGLVMLAVMVTGFAGLDRRRQNGPRGGASAP